MSKNSEKVKKWRKETKARIIESMGGKCALCGYDKCHSALAMHHIDPSQKDFSLGAIRANIKSWKTIVNELKKCILVCHNCHSEIHEGIVTMPENYPKFNPIYENYNLHFKEIKYCLSCNKQIPLHKKHCSAECLSKSRHENSSFCPICNNEIPLSKKHCSVDCASKSRCKINWDDIDLPTELKNKSVLKLAKELGCSDSAIHKRLKKLGLNIR